MAPRRDDDEEDFIEDDEIAVGDKGAALGRELEEQFTGDTRFAAVELAEPGLEDGEDFRLQLMVDNQTQFFIALLSESMVVRVGLFTESEDVSKLIEEVIHEAGDSLTEFLEASLDGNDELDYEVHQFEDEVFSYCADIPFDAASQLTSHSFVEQVILYLDAFVEGFASHLESDD